MSELTRDMFPLKGKRVLITGASRRQGIGYAIARQVAAWGGSVVIHHHKPHDEDQPWGGDDLDKVAAGIRAELTEGATFHQFSADLFDPDAPDRLMKEIADQCGHLDALICNHAQSGHDGPLGTLTADMLDRHWAVNTRSSLLLAQRFAARHDKNRGLGRIVFMTSGQRMGPMPGEVAYAAAKGAIADITLTIADQLASEGILVNTVNPGPVDTGYLTPDMWQVVRNKFPLGRFGKPQDTANLVAWLLTEEASWITGQILQSEGGFARWKDHPQN